MAKHKYTMEDWRAVRKGLDAGGTIRGVAAETGVDRGAVFRWSRRDRPPDWMWLEMEIPESPAAGAGAREPGARLTYEDRCMIHAMLASGSTRGQIARAVGTTPGPRSWTRRGRRAGPRAGSWTGTRR